MFNVPQMIFKDDAINIRNSINLQNLTRYQFQVYRCFNSTLQYYLFKYFFLIKACASNEEIDAKLQNAVLSYTVPFYEFNSLNYSSPYEIKVGIRYQSYQYCLQIKSDFHRIKYILLFFLNKYKTQELNIMKLIWICNLAHLVVIWVVFNFHSMIKSLFILVAVKIYQIYLAHYEAHLVFQEPLQKLSFATIMYNKISNKKKIKIQDYFKSKKQRSVIEEYYNIIQKAIELDSYMEIMLKYENILLTFRSDKLVTQSAELFKSQRLQQITERNDFQIVNRLDDAGLPLDQNIQQFQFEQIISAREVIDKRIFYNSDDYIVNDERSRK